MVGNVFNNHCVVRYFRKCSFVSCMLGFDHCVVQCLPDCLDMIFGCEIADFFRIPPNMIALLWAPTFPHGTASERKKI